jgi:phosphate starvation-inducible PhoH-like protein
MGKTKSRRSQNEYLYDSDDDVFGTSYSSSYNNNISSKVNIKDKSSASGSFFMNKELPQIKARNPKQEEFLKLLDDPNIPILVATGPAGCGKTHLASLMGLKKLHEGVVDKLVITRPAVSVDEDHGFLPGSLEEKMDPWMRPIYDSFYHFYSPQKIASLIDNKVIEICPLAYARGRTFENAWVIGDETQNCTVTQLMMLLTRIGRNSKMVITGDLARSDLPSGISGLRDLVLRIDKHGEGMLDIRKLHFNDNEIERDPSIKNILKLYKS